MFKKASVIVVFFTCMVSQDLGHATMARSFGDKTSEVGLLRIGGIGWLDRMPELRRKENVMAIAGSAVNVAL